MKILLLLWKMTTLCAVIILLAGCWSATELKNRAFVSVMIVDLINDEVELTLGIPLTNRLIPGQTGGTGGDGSQRPVAYVTRSGGTIEEALQKIQGDIPRKVAFGQTHSIIMGSRFAQKGVGPLLEFVSRNPFLKLNTNLFLVEGSARTKVAETPATFERFFVSVLNGYIRNHQILSTTVKDLMFSKANGGDGLIPILRFEMKEPSLKADTSANVGTAGAAILREGKMVAPTLSPEETSSARAALGQLKQYIYSVQSPTDGKEMGFYTTSLTTKIRPFKTKDGLGITIRSYSNAGVIASDSDIDLSKQENVERLEKEIKKSADSTIASVIARTQGAGADVFNFGRYISVQYPKDWDKLKGEWRAYYKNRLRIRIESVISLKQVGSSTDSFRSGFIDRGQTGGEKNGGNEAWNFNP
ncbi:Ger(x)C family spore germination protein [Cohnella hashimotonis]|uniref:Ger(X)C family spore germination protein n=1 Tax=Cohnella hashimotonis TaxID=2826895 RepID=A0ABT6TAU6_9BACL|nr:Ger(x)C family spore germination protein [Cohnella hashimotonis]MDI4643961.1 Ger(x)C family spore germination protein [Cohnella hashimotonis]